MVTWPAPALTQAAPQKTAPTAIKDFAWSSRTGWRQGLTRAGLHGLPRELSPYRGDMEINTMEAQTPEQQLAIFTGQANQRLQTVALESSALIQTGQERWGERFNEASQVVADKLGPEKVPGFMDVNRQMDLGPDIIMHLADNPGRLEALARLPVERMSTELARIEAQMSPHGRVTTDPNAAWKQTSSRTGRVSDVDWKRNHGANLTDEQWHREFDRREREKAGRR
jgi:hypothetical protein